MLTFSQFRNGFGDGCTLHQAKTPPHNSNVLPGVRTFLLFLAACVFATDSQAQLYQQNFSTALTTVSNTTTTTGVYCNSNPTLAQFNAIGSNGTGCSYGVPSGTGKLTFTRNANTGIFTRSKEFNPIPTSAVWKFDLTVSGNTVSQALAARFQMGYGFSTSTYGAESQAHASLGINLTATNGEFSLRNGANTASSTNFSGTQTIYWVINNSGGTLTYMAPDGTVNSVADDKEDVWVGNTLAFNDMAAFDPARSLRNLKFVFNAGDATIEIDNLLVANLPVAPTASDQTICAATPTVADLVASGTALKWYTALSGGSALASSDPISSGAYYVSQTVDGIESERTLVNVTASAITISNNTITADQVICTGSTFDTLRGAVPVITNGSGIFTYNWEVSTISSSAGFINMGGETDKDHIPGGSITADRWYRRKVTSDGCSQYSNVVYIDVNQVITNTISAAQNICEGSNAAAIGGAPSGGNGTYTYAWESSTTDEFSGFSTLPAETDISLNPGAITQTTWYRRTVTSLPCPSVVSDAIQITVTPSVTGNSVADNQTICTGTVPAVVVGSTPAGGNGVFAYLWEISSTSAVAGFSTTGQTTIDYTPPGSLSSNRWYRRRVVSGSCTTYSNVVAVVVEPLISTNTISAAQTICSTNAPAALTGSTPTGGSGAYTYVWESSTVSATTDFSPIAGTNSIGYAPPLLAVTTWFRRVVISGACANNVSVAVKITVNDPILNNDIDAPQTICTGTVPAGLTGTLPVGGNGTSYAYQWEVATSAGGSFSSAGIVTQNFSPATLTANRWYRRRVTSGVCPVHYSDTVAITVHPNIANNTISAAQTICSIAAPASLTGSTPTGGNGTYSYIWEASTVSATTDFTVISGANSISYAPPLLTQSTWYRRIVVSGPCLNSTSTAIKITVNYPNGNNLISAPQTICTGTTPAGLTGTLPTGGNGTSFSYLWEVATSPGGSFSAASGGSGQNYSPSSLTASRWYRRRVTSGVCAVIYSDTIEITVHPNIGSNTISAAQTICNGTVPATLTGTTPTGGSGSYSYMWESSTTSATTGFSVISGETNASYSPPAIPVSTWYRRIVVAGPCANNTSAAIKITVTYPIEDNTIASDQIICSGTIPATINGSLPSGGTGTFAYLWEYATSAGGSFASLGSTAQNYTTGSALTASRWYRRRVTSGVCAVSYSDTILVTVTPSIAANSITGTQTLCNGISASNINGSVPTGGNGSGSYQYIWESSVTSASAGYSIIDDSVRQSYAPGVMFTTTWFRRKVVSGACTSTSAIVTKTVTPPPTVSAGGAIPTISQGGTTIALGGSFGGSATGAVWSAFGGTFSNNTGPTPDLATYTASPTSSATVTITISSTGSPCGVATDSKVLTVIPDTNQITGVVNQYEKVVGPANIAVGSLSVTLAAGGGNTFAPGDKALIIQMKGASISTSTSSESVNGSITNLNNSGNYEFVKIGSVAGDVITFERCLKKPYTASGKVQLIKVARFNTSKTVVGSQSVTSVRLIRKGMGYAKNTTIYPTVDNTGSGGSGLSVSANTDSLGQVYEVNILSGGEGYQTSPTINFPTPTVSPYDLPAYAARAKAVLTLTGKQWNGNVGGVLVFEIDGNINLGNNIDMDGMGFAGGMFGDRAGAVNPSATATYSAGFFTGHGQAGQKGEGVNNIFSNSLHHRGRGKNSFGGGGGFDSEAGGGGGANWNDGGKGGTISYTYSSNCIGSAFYITGSPLVYPTDKGGVGGASGGAPNGVRAKAYYFSADKSKIYLGGGGGGGHSVNATLGEELNGAGGYGGGIIIITCTNFTSNSFEVRAEGMQGEDVTTGDGAGGGGGGGTILMDIDTYTDNFNGRVNGGRGGNTDAEVCYTINDFDTYRFCGAGGSGGGGVVWFGNGELQTNALSLSCNLGQAARGTNQDNNGNTAQKGGSSRDQHSNVFVENAPYLGSVFTVGGTSPKPTFPDLLKASEWLSFKGTDATEVTLLVKENTSLPSKIYDYQTPVTFTRIYTPGCVPGDATLVIKPLTTVNSVDLTYPDASVYMTFDGIPAVTFKDLKITGETPSNSYMFTVKNGTNLKFDNVTIAGGVTLTNAGSNQLDLLNTTHAGSVVAQDNQVININGTTTLVGSNANNKSLSFGAGSIFNLPAGKVLNINGANWINNGGILNIDPASTINLTGSITSQAIGGSVTTDFDKLNVSSTGVIAVSVNTNVNKWLQTGTAVINHGTKLFTIKEKITMAGGQFLASGAGRVVLSNPTTAVEAEGTFANLEINSAAHVTSTNPITVNQNLLLTNGMFNNGSHLVTINTTSPSAIVFGTNSWVTGKLRRKVAAGGFYNFPVGKSAALQKASLLINSLTGMQFATVQFFSNNPNLHPSPSVFPPTLDSLTYFSSLLPNGYWNIEPDAGTANYDIWLSPTYMSGHPTYTVAKRPTASTLWGIYGTFSNPEETDDYIQADGSVRRTGLTAFSDFAVVGGDYPLPLNFLSFTASRKSKNIQLSWKMGDCFRNGSFTIKRGTTATNLTPFTQVNVDGESECQSEFESIDANLPKATRLFYQIEASARDEKTIQSEVRSVNVIDRSAENPFLSRIVGEPKRFTLNSPDIEETGINIYSIDGKEVGRNLRAVERILDLNSVSSGVYMVEMVNGGWTVRQKIVVGF